MAKGKHAAALFEVIHADKRFDRKKGVSGALQTPRWWFKNKTPSAPLSAPPSGVHAIAAKAIAGAPAPSGALPAGMAIKVDPDRQQVSFRLTYTSAAIAAFALLVVVGLAYLVGSRLRSGPTAAGASPAIEELQKQASQPQVMDVPRGGGDAPATDAAIPTVESVGDSAPAQPPPTTVVQGAQRQNNLNYVVVQSYPDPADAREARDLLAKNGVDSTIEVGLRGLHPDWHTVVGADGFTSISAPEYKAYIERVQRISDRNYSQKRSFKAFQPMGYKWDRAGR